jgi:hypothetical protein
LKQQILSDSHDSPKVGNIGFLKTYERMKKYFLGEGMEKYILKFVKECHVFQRNKEEMVKL